MSQNEQISQQEYVTKCKKAATEGNLMGSVNKWGQSKIVKLTGGIQMKKSFFLSILFLSMFISASVHAEKPEMAGKGKPSAEQKEAQKSSKKAKEGIEDEIEDEIEVKKDKAAKSKKVKEEKFENELDTAEGFEKQKSKKEQQVQKELGKGSEKGQEARESRKKWWKFWGE